MLGTGMFGGKSILRKWNRKYKSFGEVIYWVF